MAARCSRISWPVPPLLLLLQSFIPKHLCRAQSRREAAFLTDVAFMFAWILLFCDGMGSHGCHRYCLKMWSQKHQAFLLSPITESGCWWSVLPFPRPPHPDLAVGVTSHLCPWPTHWSSSVFAILSCLLPAGATRKPKGDFQGLMAGGHTQRVFLTLQRREVKSLKKKKKSHRQTHTNLL